MKHKHDKVTLKQYNIQTGENKDYGPKLPDECSSVQSLGLHGGTGAPAPYVLCSNLDAFSVQYLSSEADEWHTIHPTIIDGLLQLSSWSSGQLSSWYWAIQTDERLTVFKEEPTGNLNTICQSSITSSYAQSHWSKTATVFAMLDSDGSSVSICDMHNGQWSQHNLRFDADPSYSKLELLPKDEENSDWLIVLRKRHSYYQYLDIYMIGWLLRHAITT